ncbi:helix-turn-helix domain-containing protein [Neobacillus sp. LXY-1]|uniref:helix-turn-helix domain-containing protein n=1 Tax=Neobacillus sp. LXY-1 TaxID=3379133 RepID=UPI003EE2E6AD
MSEGKMNRNLGLFLKKVLHERSLSMRKLSELTEIDPATISRIINGKRKANIEHLQKIADQLGIPISELLDAAGYSNERKMNIPESDFFMSVDHIQQLLESSNLLDNDFSISSVEGQLAHYEQYVQTDEGKENILKSFKEKLKKIGSIGPFINQLQEMYEKFRFNKGTPRELVLLGSALVYFIVSVDVIPDYIFPVGYIDDAMAIQIVTKSLLKL